jgi:hypothetical protein
MGSARKDTRGKDSRGRFVCRGDHVVAAERWNVGLGKVVGVAGIGGMGTWEIQLAKARGAEKVIAFTTSSISVPAIVRRSIVTGTKSIPPGGVGVSMPTVTSVPS